MFFEKIFYIILLLKLINGKVLTENAEQHLDTVEATENPNNLTMIEKEVAGLIANNEFEKAEQAILNMYTNFIDFDRVRKIFLDVNNTNLLSEFANTCKNINIRYHCLVVLWEKQLNKNDERKRELIESGLKVIKYELNSPRYMYNKIAYQVLSDIQKIAGISIHDTVWNVTTDVVVDNVKGFRNVLYFIRRNLRENVAIMPRAYYVTKILKSVNYSSLQQNVKTEVHREFDNLPLAAKNIYFLHAVYIQNHHRYIKFTNGIIAHGNVYMPSSPWVVNHVKNDVFQFRKSGTQKYLSISKDKVGKKQLVSNTLDEMNSTEFSTEWQLIFHEQQMDLFNVHFQVFLCRSVRLVFLSSVQRDSNPGLCGWTIDE